MHNISYSLVTVNDKVTDFITINITYVTNYYLLLKDILLADNVGYFSTTKPIKEYVRHEFLNKYLT